MNTATSLDAALTALTVLAEHLDDGFSADPGLRTPAEMACAAHGLPEDQAPAIAMIASFWVALAGGRAPASLGSNDPEGDNLTQIWAHPACQAGDLQTAAWMIREWRAYLALAAGSAHAQPAPGPPEPPRPAARHGPRRKEPPTPMPNTATTRLSHAQQPGRTDMDQHHHAEHPLTASRAADQGPARPQRGAPPRARIPGIRQPGRRRGPHRARRTAAR